MALTVHTREGDTGVSGDLTADRRLYVNKDRTKLVEEGAPDAAFLLAPPGSSIPLADVQGLGLAVVNGRIVQGGQKEAPKPEDKARAQTENKAVTKKGTK